MFELIIEFDDGRIEKHFFDTKEEVEMEVEFQWTEDADFSIGLTDCQMFCFWEDRFDFGW